MHRRGWRLLRRALMLRRLSSGLSVDRQEEMGWYTHLGEVFEVQVIQRGADSYEYQGGITEVDNLIVAIPAVVLNAAYTKRD